MPPPSAPLRFWSSFVAVRLRQYLLGSLHEPPLPLAEPQECLVQLSRVEIGPQNIGNVEFRIGNLPQEKVADAVLTARPDEQIRVREVGAVEVTADRGLVDVLGP